MFGCMGKYQVDEQVLLSQLVDFVFDISFIDCECKIGLMVKVDLEYYCYLIVVLNKLVVSF